MGRYRERQYQLAAQKHNRQCLKYDYYQQIAKYFERECRIAKHYDSWNYRTLDRESELEKTKKAERLEARRNKLRNLLKEEDETYRRELEERKRIKNRPEEISLEVLRRKLREKRAEQSLYLPKTCRRYQSYFVCPTETNAPGWNTLRDTNLQYSRACRESTNLIRQNSYSRGSKMSENSNKGSQEQENIDARQEEKSLLSSQNLESERPKSRYSARYARRSLENTNVRNDDFVDSPSRAASTSSFTYGSTSSTEKLVNEKILLRGDDKENRTEDTKSNGPQNGRIIERSPSNDGNSKSLAQQELIPPQKNDENDSLKQSDRLTDNAYDTRRSEHSEKEYQDTKKNDTRQFEIEKSLPWLRMDPSDKNLSKEMFLYLTHKELKCKIEDLARREMHACNKQCWDEALRLRDMRNKLELIREKRLYNMENLELDEEARKRGLVNIDKREAELIEREKICMDSMMYSEEAKALWKKWVHEDERFVIKDARQEREKLMNNLEKEWQNLAIREKERISRSYQNVMNESALQEEHKLAAAINAARIKPLSNSLK